MRQVRSNIFETNSSSTHSLTICTYEEFNKWKNGELLFDKYNEEFVECLKLTDNDKDQAKEYYISIKSTYWKDWEQLSEEEIKSWYAKYANERMRDRCCYGLQTYNEYQEDYDLERFERHYTSPSGDKLVAFGKYGYED